MCKIKFPSTLTRLARHMILPQNHMELPMLTSASPWTFPRIQARKRNRATWCLMWANTVKCLQPVQPLLAARAVKALQAPNPTLLTNCSACARSNFRVPSPGLRAIGPKNRAYGPPPFPLPVGPYGPQQDPESGERLFHPVVVVVGWVQEAMRDFIAYHLIGQGGNDYPPNGSVPPPLLQ